MTQSPTERMTAARKADLALAQANEAVRLNEEAVRLNAESKAMIQELHDAWMKPHAGYGNRPLIECVSELVVDTQSGKVIGAKLVWWAKVLGALSVIGGAFYTAVAWGGSVPR